jgi:hypothetical protein
MSPDEYFDAHIPHRVNLLITFRQRYSGRYPEIALRQESYRDLFLCAKDMSLLMVRFFCKEMGIHLPKGENEVKECNNRSSFFKGSKLTKAELLADRGKYEELCEVLRAANRAVAHMEDGEVDHLFKTDSDNERIFRVVDLIEDLVKEKIYKAAGRDFKHSISLRNNVMY